MRLHYNEVKHMKFKIIFVLFNIVIIVSFLAIYLMPLVMLDLDYAKDFWGRNWGLPVLFFVIIGLLNAYFIFNWKLFSLLEKEDWPALIDHLEHRIYERKLIVGQQVKILANAYLVRSDVEAIGRLEMFIRENKPRILPKFALVFGIPYLLRNDSEEMVRYFSQFAGIKGNDGVWIRWNCAFAHVLNGEASKAEAILSKLSAEKTEPVLALLSVYLLHSLNPNAEHMSIVEAKRAKLREKYTREGLLREIERSKGSVQVVVLQKLIEEATEWLFSDSRGAPVH
jgi:hypothetical protein